MPLTLVAPLPEDHPVLTPPPNPSKPPAGSDPARHDEARAYALLHIAGQFSSVLLGRLADRDLIACYVSEYLAAGVGPDRARVLFSRLKNGVSLTVIDGGGENAPAPSPSLRLVRPTAA